MVSGSMESYWSKLQSAKLRKRGEPTPNKLGGETKRGVPIVSHVQRTRGLDEQGGGKVNGKQVLNSWTSECLDQSGILDSKEGTQEVQDGGRYEVAESSLSPSQFQTGDIGQYIEHNFVELLDGIFRSGPGISPRECPRGNKEVLWDKVERENAGLLSAAFRLEHESLYILKNSKGPYKLLEETRPDCVRLLGRFSNMCPIEGESVSSEKDNRERSVGFGSDSRGIQGFMGTNSSDSTLGIEDRYDFGEGLYSRREVNCLGKSIATNFEKLSKRGRDISQDVGKIGWENNKFIKSFRPSKSLYERTVSNYRVLPIMGGKGSSLTSVMGGSGLDFKESEKEKREISVSADSSSLFGGRRINDGMGCQAARTDSGSKLELNRNRMAHKSKRTASSMDGNIVLQRDVAKEELDHSSGLNNILSLSKESRWSDQLLNEDIQKYLGNYGSTGNVPSGSRMDSVRIKYDSGSTLPGGRYRGLGSFGSSLWDVGSEMGSVYDRQIRLPFEQEMWQVQFPEEMPRSGNGECVRGGLEWRNELFSSTTPHYSFGVKTRDRMQSERGDNSAELEKFLVANINVDHCGRNGVASSQQELSTRSIPIVRTREEQGMGIFGSVDRWTSRAALTKDRIKLDSLKTRVGGLYDLEGIREICLSKAKAAGTWKVFDKGWKEFVTFCNKFRLKSLPASQECVINFIAFCVAEGKALYAKSWVAAISIKHQEKGYSSPTLTYAVKQALRGLDKLSAESKKLRELRDPLPLDCVRFYAQNKPGNVSYVTWYRNLVVVVIGIRCIRRPSEITYIRRGDVSFREGKAIIRIPKSKTDQLGRGQIIPIDAVPGSCICPVEIISNWMSLTSGSLEDQLLKHPVTKKELSVSNISKIVKSVAEHGGYVGNFSGYSLRIAGATLAAQSMSVGQVRSIGGWTGSSIQKYIRAEETANRGASRLMGF